MSEKEQYKPDEVRLIVETLNSHFATITDFVESVTRSITQMSINQMSQCKLLEELKTQYTISEKMFIDSCELIKKVLDPENENSVTSIVRLTKKTLDPESKDSITSIIRGLKLSLQIAAGAFAIISTLMGALMATGLIKITFILPGGGS